VLLEHGGHTISPQGCEDKDEATNEAETFELADPQATGEAGDGEGCHDTSDTQAQHGGGARDDDIQHQQPELQSKGVQGEMQ